MLMLHPGLARGCVYSKDFFIHCVNNTYGLRLNTYELDQETGRSYARTDGTNVNHALVKYGWCWWYRKYAPGNTVLEELEKEAREARKRLWADPQPVPLWE